MLQHLVQQHSQRQEVAKNSMALQRAFTTLDECLTEIQISLNKSLKVKKLLQKDKQHQQAD